MAAERRLMTQQDDDAPAAPPDSTDPGSGGFTGLDANVSLWMLRALCYLFATNPCPI